MSTSKKISTVVELTQESGEEKELHIAGVIRDGDLVDLTLSNGEDNLYLSGTQLLPLMGILSEFASVISKEGLK